MTWDAVFMVGFALYLLLWLCIAVGVLGLAAESLSDGALGHHIREQQRRLRESERAWRGEAGRRL